MKKTKLFLCGLLSVACCFSAVFSGCSSSNGATNSETEIEIRYWNSGMGLDFLNAVKVAFETKYPEYTVFIDPTSDVNSVGTNLDTGRDVGDSVDIYMGAMGNFTASVDYIEPLDDLLSTKIDGESVTVADKVKTGFLDGMVVNGKVYALPWANLPMSLTYNKTVFDSMGYSLPRTTDELYALATQIYDDGNSGDIKVDGQKVTAPNSNSAPAPFIHSRSGYEYWTSLQYSRVF